MKKYNIIIIGNGLIGSAAARYLSEWDESVAAIGPSEPQDQRRHRGVFSSHYDQGRLTHEFSPDPIWSVVASQAVQKYAWLEEQSGVRFHGAVGRVLANRPTAAERQNFLTWMATVDPSGEKLHYYRAGDLTWKERFPFLDFPDDFDLFYETAPAGYINPRQMLRAQNLIAQQQGAEFVDQRVVEVRSTTDGVTVVTAEGEHFSAAKVLVACGAFTNFNNLLPEPIPLRLKTESTIWGQVSAETAARLQNMPGVGYNIEGAEVDDIYMAPPLLYRDGTYQIKMGCNTANELWPTTLAELQAWFQNGPSDLDLLAMARALRSLLPDVEFLRLTTHRCIVTYTPSGYPTIDRVPSDPHGRLFVATGGNGSGAQGADTLGHLAAGLLYDGRWMEELPRDLFLVTNEWGASKKQLTKAQERALVRG